MAPKQLVIDIPVTYPPHYEEIALFPSEEYFVLPSYANAMDDSRAQIKQTQNHFNYIATLIFCCTFSLVTSLGMLYMDWSPLVVVVIGLLTSLAMNFVSVIIWFIESWALPSSPQEKEASSEKTGRPSPKTILLTIVADIAIVLSVKYFYGQSINQALSFYWLWISTSPAIPEASRIVVVTILMHLLLAQASMSLLEAYDSYLDIFPQAIDSEDSLPVYTKTEVLKKP